MEPEVPCATAELPLVLALFKPAGATAELGLTVVCATAEEGTSTGAFVPEVFPKHFVLVSRGLCLLGAFLPVSFPAGGTPLAKEGIFAVTDLAVKEAVGKFAGTDLAVEEEVGGSSAGDLPLPKVWFECFLNSIVSGSPLEAAIFNWLCSHPLMVHGYLCRSREVHARVDTWLHGHTCSEPTGC